MPEAMIDRMDKINELVRREIARVVFDLIEGEFISINQVRVSKDLSYAKVWLSAVGDTEKIVKRCQDLSPEIKRELAKNLKLKKVPNLHFVGDFTDQKADKIETMIQEISKESQKGRGGDKDSKESK